MAISAALLELLSVYYMCDYIATTRLVSQDEAAMCMSVYTDVKAEISGLNPNDPKENVEAYVIWKEWEKDNAELVKELKENAKEVLDNN